MQYVPFIRNSLYLNICNPFSLKPIYSLLFSRTAAWFLCKIVETSSDFSGSIWPLGPGLAGDQCSVTHTPSTRTYHDRVRPVRDAPPREPDDPDLKCNFHIPWPTLFGKSIQSEGAVVGVAFECRENQGCRMEGCIIIWHLAFVTLGTSLSFLAISIFCISSHYWGNAENCKWFDSNPFFFSSFKFSFLSKVATSSESHGFPKDIGQRIRERG